MSAYKIKSNCLKMMGFTNITGNVPDIQIESNIVYLTVPEDDLENKNRILQEKRGKHDNKGHHGDRNKNDKKGFHGDKKEYEELMIYENLDSSTDQFMIFFCPFWKSETENTFTYKLSLKTMDEFEYYYSKSSFLYFY